MPNRSSDQNRWLESIKAAHYMQNNLEQTGKLNVARPPTKKKTNWKNEKK